MLTSSRMTARDQAYREVVKTAQAALNVKKLERDNIGRAWLDASFTDSSFAHYRVPADGGCEWRPPLDSGGAERLANVPHAHDARLGQMVGHASHRIARATLDVRAGEQATARPPRTFHLGV